MNRRTVLISIIAIAIVIGFGSFVVMRSDNAASPTISRPGSSQRDTPPAGPPANDPPSNQTSSELAASGPEHVALLFLIASIIGYRLHMRQRAFAGSGV